jgi:hypothetical protein
MKDPASWLFLHVTSIFYIKLLLVSETCSMQEYCNLQNTRRLFASRLLFNLDSRWAKSETSLWDELYACFKGYKYDVMSVSPCMYRSFNKGNSPFVQGSCLNYVICVCLCIVVSNTYCVVVFVLLVFVLRSSFSQLH